MKRFARTPMFSMKKKSHLWPTLGACLAAALPQAQALELRGFYVDVDAGGVFQQDLSISSDVTPSAGKVSFNPGFRGNLSLGYAISDSLDVGIQTGILWNSIDQVQGDSLSGSTFYQVPLLTSANYRFPLKGGWTPFVGAGVGGVMSFIDLHTPLGDLSSSDLTFAYQVAAGCKYAVNENCEFGISYQFLGSLEHEWSDGGISLTTDGSLSHSFLASFTWKF